MSALGLEDEEVSRSSPPGPLDAAVQDAGCARRPS